MAKENEDGQEKTEEPTDRKLEKARQEGQILTSVEVPIFTTLAMGLVMMMSVGFVSNDALTAWGQLFVIDSSFNLDTLGLAKVHYAFSLIIWATLIIGVPMIIVILLTQAGVGGLNFAPKAMVFKPSKINPLAGMKRMFSAKSLVNLFKSILKVVLLFGISAFIIYRELGSILHLSNSSLHQALGKMSEVFPLLIGTLLIALLIIAAIDYFWQKHTHTESMKMTLKEVKDEHKQSEGSPEVNSKIRRMQMQMSREYSQQRDALDNVSDATTVITNPTHFAIALKYSSGQTGAPIVLAMGRGTLAQQIIERAAEANVRTLRIPTLARALYYTSEIGGEITEGLYNAVAVILAYVFRIDGGENLEMPEFTLPPELQFDEFGNRESEAA
ncbi:MAG: flagellar biosynthesis protein FlhB [Bacteroidetes bacterium]|nr:flagellar biosynthesis protein FlhB [Bacteroidota bacterium]